MIKEKVPPALNLPEPGSRWVPSRKEAVLEGIALGNITEEEVLRRYPDLTLEELHSWERRFNRGGRNGLRITKPPV